MRCLRRCWVKKMPVTIKTEHEIELMRVAGRYLAEVHEELAAALKPGMTTKDIDRLGEKLIRKRGCIPSFLGYSGFPASICVSVNEEVVHGIPSDKRVIEEGDLVSLDAGLIYKGFQSDAARSYVIGNCDEAKMKLVEATKEAFFRGIAAATDGAHLHDIGAAISDYIEPLGYGIVEDLVGHGIGREMHEPPEVPNFRQRSRGIRLRKGMTIAVEPMINMGTWQVDFLDDGWTTLTADRKPSAHYENTILITDGAPEILSLLGGRRS